MARCTYAWITLYLPSPPLPADHFIPPPLPPWSSVPSVQSRDPGHCGHPSATRAAASCQGERDLFPMEVGQSSDLGVPCLPASHPSKDAGYHPLVITLSFPDTTVTYRTLINLQPKM